MSMTIQAKPKRTRVIVALVASLLLAGGLYLLATSLAPTVNRVLIDSSHNQTTEMLTETQDTITENRLYIPKIDINMPYAVGDETVMEHGAWWRAPASGNPASGGNFVLSAHRFVMGWNPVETARKSPLYNIDRLEIGDEITIDYEGERYVYVIDEKHTVAPTAIEIEDPTDDNRLTLYSCTLAGAADGRDVIIAKLKDSSEV